MKASQMQAAAGRKVGLIGAASETQAERMIARLESRRRLLAVVRRDGIGQLLLHFRRGRAVEPAFEMQYRHTID